MLEIQPGGLLRTVDELGRLVLPADWRRHVGVKGGDQLEIIPGRNGSLVIQIYTPTVQCVFCLNKTNVEQVAGRGVCTSCLETIRGSPRST